MKKELGKSLSSLLQPDADTQQKIVTDDSMKAAKSLKNEMKTKSVCYVLPEELIEKIKYIAYYDRKKINAVVIEALTAYVDTWNEDVHIAEKAKKL